MKKFPKAFNPKQKNKFPILLQERRLIVLREKVMDYVLSGNKNGLDLCCSSNGDNFDYQKPNQNDVKKIISELEKIGWKTKLAYGDTTLFIYENESELPKIQDTEPIEN